MVMASKVTSKEINPAKEIKDFTDKEKKAYGLIQSLINSCGGKVKKAKATKEIQNKEIYNQIYQCKKVVKLLLHNHNTFIESEGSYIVFKRGEGDE